MNGSDTHEGGLSVPTTRVSTEDDMDAMVSRASRPSLASLFKAGKDAGLIKPGTEYGHTT